MRRAVIVAGLVACADVPQPFDLDHARIMAVRIEPPALAAGETARVDVLATDATATPQLVPPGALTIEASAGVRVEQTADGWLVHAPDSAGLAALRAGLGLAADADVIVPLALAVATAEGPLVAAKTVAFGAHADNPVAPAITVDGALDVTSIPSGRDSSLAAAPALPELSYRWFSSVGDLVGYTRAEAALEPTPDTRGLVVLVARDQAGGTAWTIAPVVVAP